MINFSKWYHWSSRLIVGLLVFFLFPFLALSSVSAITVEECEEKVGKIELSLDEYHQCEQYFNNLYQQANSQKRTLQTEIKKFNAAISVTQTKIFSTNKQILELEKQIEELSEKIGRLDVSLNQISELLLKRIVETYKKGKVDALEILLSSKGFPEFISRYKYLQVIQTHDKKILVQLETARTNYEEQKNLKEEKQKELEEAKKKLESQKVLLAQQKADKEKLLIVSQNNELRYQSLLATTRAELEAIQGIIAGRGQETEVGKVNAGDNIAWVIAGASACSTGTHLHFELRDGENVKDPFSYLRNIDLIDNSGGDPHSGIGSWDWPLNSPVKFNQGFGDNTSAIRSGIVWYKFHTGIDIASDNLRVKSVRPGTLYRGAIACGGGTLRYVRVRHDSENIDTYYLHIDY